MSESRAASRRLFSPVLLTAVAFAFALAGCDAADPHVPAVVRAPSQVSQSISSSPSSPQAAALPTAARDGLVPPVMHTVD